MENNYKNREMFFGQYIGQEVFCDTSEPLEKVTYQTLLSYVGDMSNNFFHSSRCQRGVGLKQKCYNACG